MELFLEDGRWGFQAERRRKLLRLCPSVGGLVRCLCVYKRVKVKVTWLCPTLCDPMDYTVRGILQARILEWIAFPFSRGSSQPRDQTQVSRIADGFLPTEPPGKPKNAAVGGLSLFQGIFLTQESNRDLLHCRWILNQLSYQGSPYKTGVDKSEAFEKASEASV